MARLFDDVITSHHAGVGCVVDMAHHTTQAAGLRRRCWLERYISMTSDVTRCYRHNMATSHVIDIARVESAWLRHDCSPGASRHHHVVATPDIIARPSRIFADVACYYVATTITIRRRMTLRCWLLVVTGLRSTVRLPSSLLPVGHHTAKQENNVVGHNHMRHHRRHRHGGNTRRLYELTRLANGCATLLVINGTREYRRITRSRILMSRQARRQWYHNR